MCGIGGILLPSHSAPDDLREVLGRMQRSLMHRGQDDSGLFLSPHPPAGQPPIPRCGLVHTRLSILDLSQAGHQPMSTPDGRYTIVFNGEIYNFRELRRRLAALGVKFRSESDTEVLLHLCVERGPACVAELRGMFAFAIWDQRERSCFLARDPFGIKPLYYAQTPIGMIFASELRTVLASGLVSRKLDAHGVCGFFQTGTVPEPATLVESVCALPAGASLLWKSGTPVLDRHWTLRFECDRIFEADAAQLAREALLDSVRHHFVSDVPVGVFLSGGIDSTAVAALSRAVGQQELRTFSISFEDPQFNEGHLAQRTALQFRTRHSDCRVKSETGRELFQQFLTHLDQPSIDGFNTFTVSKFARESGMKVVLSGLGGDELFGGYPSFQRVPQMARTARWLGPLRPLAGRVLERSSMPQRRRLGAFLRQACSLLTAYRAYRGVFSFDEGRKLAAHYCGIPAESLAQDPPGHLAQPTDVDEVSALELTHYMRNQLLRDSDVMSMAWGLELRVPLVDRTLVETLATIPASLRLRAGKKLLIEAVPEVPEWIWNRPKRGFLFPFEKWIEGDWREMFRAANRNGTRAQTWYQKWSIFVFEHWCERNGIAL